MLDALNKIDSQTDRKRYGRPDPSVRWPIIFRNILRTLAPPGPVKDWSPTSLKEKLIKIGAKVVSHRRHIASQMAEAAISGNLFADILRKIAEPQPPQVASSA
jgi:hypothetical protein